MSDGSLKFDNEDARYPTNHRTRICTLLSAARSGLGCSLPSLARFARLMQKSALLRELLRNRWPKETDAHSPMGGGNRVPWCLASALSAI